MSTITAEIEDTLSSPQKKYDWIVGQTGKEIKENNIFASFIGTISIYSMIVPVVMMDIFLFQYQLFFFGIFNIPKIDRSEYLLFDRYELNGLNIMQKINCVYCAYTNGMIAFAKDVANQTEIYTCAIKHSRKVRGDEHHKYFHERSKFE